MLAADLEIWTPPHQLAQAVPHHALYSNVRHMHFYRNTATFQMQRHHGRALVNLLTHVELLLSDLLLYLESPFCDLLFHVELSRRSFLVGCFPKRSLIRRSCSMHSSVLMLWLKNLLPWGRRILGSMAII